VYSTPYLLDDPGTAARPLHAETLSKRTWATSWLLIRMQGIPKDRCAILHTYPCIMTCHIFPPISPRVSCIGENHLAQRTQPEAGDDMEMSKKTLGIGAKQTEAGATHAPVIPVLPVRTSSRQPRGDRGSPGGKTCSIPTIHRSVELNIMRAFPKVGPELMLRSEQH
jgi:hypothetical protein